MSDEPNLPVGDSPTAEHIHRTTTIFHFLPTVEVDMAARSHKGNVRANNEDHFFVGRWGRFLEAVGTNVPENDLPRHVEEVGYALIVADGMGGEEGGEVASRLAIRTAIQNVMQMPEWLMRADDGQGQGIIEKTVAGYRLVDATLRQHAAGNLNLARMGTTMTMAYSVGIDLFVAHIGDSRAYLLRDGQLRQLTRDQTVAQLLVERGELSAEQAASHRLRHVLTQVLGGQDEPLKVDVQQISLHDGDWLLLCSDGLSDMVTNESLARIIVGADSAAAACEALIKEALAMGGRDNVTAAVARYRLPSRA